MYKDVRQAIDNKLESLRGNLNRMCVIDSREELQDRFGYAVNNILSLRSLNMQRLAEKGLKKES